MSDPVAARAESTRWREAAPRPDGPVRPGRRVTIAALVRAFLIAAGLVTASCLLLLDGAGTGATTALLAYGMLAVAVVFARRVRAIAPSPCPRLKAVEALAATVGFGGIAARSRTGRMPATLQMAGGLLPAGAGRRPHGSRGEP